MKFLILMVIFYWKWFKIGTGIKKIKTKQEYELALQQFKKVFHAESGTKEGKLMLQLADIIEEYEAKYYPIGKPQQTTLNDLQEAKAEKAQKHKITKDLFDFLNK